MSDVRVDSVDRNSDSDEREREGSLKSILLPSPSSTAGKAATIIFFIAVFTTFAVIHTSRNFDISGDFLGVIALLKNVASYGSFYGSPDLAWPGGIDGSHYPITNISIFAFVYLLGFITQDPFKIFVITSSALCVANSASFVWLGRKLGVNLFYCIVGSISFAFSHYFFWRSTGHFFLTDYYVLAFGLALALHISGWIKISATPLGVSIVALLSGCGNAYYTFFNLMMISIAIVGLVPTRGPLLSILRGFGVAVLCALPALSAAIATSGKISVVKRTLSDQPLYALRFMDAYIPHIEGITNHTWHEYLSHVRPISEGVEFVGYAALLGTILALVILFGSLRAPTHASSQTFRRLESRLSIFGVYILCMVVFALPFGAGLAFNAFIISAFHSQNRISILLVLLGVLSLCLVAQYIRDASKARILGGARIVGAALIILPVVVDFYQTRNVALHSYQTCPSHDENSKRQCERKLSAQLKTAFTAMRLSNIRHVALFPNHPFPEAGPLGSRSDYFGFIPYILEPADLDVAYSYGMSRRSKTFKSLKAAESALLASDGTDNSIARAVADVACIGYDAIIVDRQAYSAKDRSLLDDRLLRDTHAALLSESNDYRLYRLAKPSAVDCITRGK